VRLLQLVNEVSMRGKNPVKGLLNDGPTSLSLARLPIRSAQVWSGLKTRVGRNKGSPVPAFLRRRRW